MYRCGNGVPRSSEEAVRWLTAAADRGYVPACCILAEMYEQGDGVPRSKEMACEWYRKAADNAGEEITRELI
jgi:TPR repeat protein